MTMRTFGSCGGIRLTESLPIGVGYYTLASDGEAVCSVFQIPVSGTLTKVAFATFTVITGDSGMLVTLETVDGSTGNPSGTLYAANSNGTVNIADTDDNKIIECNINSGTGVSVNVGDVVALRVARPTGGTFNGRIQTIQMGEANRGFPYTLSYISSTWTKSAGYYGCVALYIGGSWVLPNGSALQANATTEAINDPGDPEERGLLINLPFKARLSGVTAHIAAAAGENYRFVLYSDPTGTPVAELTGDDQDADLRTSTNARWVNYYFESGFVLAANTSYVLAVQPTTSNEINLSYTSHGSGVTTYANALPYGATMCWYGRDDTGAFSSTADRCPCIIPIFDQFDDGASTGGSAPRFGDRTGGLR